MIRKTKLKLKYTAELSNNLCFLVFKSGCVVNFEHAIMCSESKVHKSCIYI